MSLSYEAWLNPWMPEKAGRLALDIGANGGRWTSQLLDVGYDRVIAFEPDPNAAKEFRRNQRDFRIDFREMAVGAESGTLTLNFYDESIHTSAIIYDDPVLNLYGRGPVTGEFEVPMVALDDLIFDGLDFVKVDTEGYESKVLRGAENTLRQHRPYLIVELHGYFGPACEKFLENLGYETELVQESWLVAK